MIKILVLIPHPLPLWQQNVIASTIWTAERA